MSNPTSQIFKLGTPQQTPLSNLNLDPTAAKYVGLLEAQLAAYAINEAKYRCLLEMLTGDVWDSTKVDVDGTVLMDIAVGALVKRGMDVQKATLLVTDRWNKHNQPVAPVVTETPEPPTMEQRLQDWKSRKEARISSETAESE